MDKPIEMTVTVTSEPTGLAVEEATNAVKDALRALVEARRAQLREGKEDHAEARLCSLELGVRTQGVWAVGLAIVKGEV
jgi:hypothetical protein